HHTILSYSHLSSLIFFFFQYYRHLPHLHSFPTRRSSDLIGPGTVVQRGDTLEVSGPQAAVERLAPLVGRMIHPTEDTDFIVLGTDRKSTRLNSSHVSISYAVFCLKKKKKKIKCRITMLTK